MMKLHVLPDAPNPARVIFFVNEQRRVLGDAMGVASSVTMRALATVLIFATLLTHQTANAAIKFDWQDQFSPSEQAKLQIWIENTVAGVEALVGPYPFELHIRMYRKDGAREPVPWANTIRGNLQGVNFHVDPRFSLDDFRSDWTASHELSHLIFPYLGRSASWFSEGFASFMQYQVMMATRDLTSDEAIERYLSRLNRASSDYPYQSSPFSDAAPKLRRAGKYPVMYWGGAAYFLQVDDKLRNSSDQTLISVLGRYLQCCRQDRKNLDTLVQDLDRLSNSTIFSDCLNRFRTEPGFPAYDMLESE